MRRTFSSGTQDCANKFVASEAVFGTSTVHPIPDLDHTDLCLVIGENPRASQASFYSIPNVLGTMRRATARGARFVFVNPRRIETPERGVGDTVLIRPDTDVWFLAALLHEIDRRGGFDEAVVAAPRQPPRRAAGVPRAVRRGRRRRRSPASTPTCVRELAAAWVATPRASVHASTGLNMGRQGSLAYWLVHMLSFVTGRLDVEGGNLKSDGFYANARSGAGVVEQSYVDTEFGRLREGALPGTLMADAILDSAEPVRAMIVVAGNPLLSIAGQERLRKAFEQLELLVVIDIYPSATAELADVVLPCTDMYERDDLNVVNIGTSARPFAQYTPAVVAPAAERRPEWWIAHRLLQELGHPSLLDDDEPDPWAKWRHMLQRGAGIELADLQASGEPHVLPPPEPGDVLRASRCGRPTVGSTAARRCSPRPSHDAPSCSTERSRERGGLKLIHGRDPWMHNTWLANLPRMRRRGRTTNPLAIHPADAAAPASPTAIGSSCPTPTARSPPRPPFDDDLMPGVVSMVHGWGHAASPRLRVAAEHPGTNPNVLLPSGPGSYEPLSSQAHMTGIPVTVIPVASRARPVTATVGAAHRAIGGHPVGPGTVPPATEQSGSTCPSRSCRPAGALEQCLAGVRVDRTAETAPMAIPRASAPSRTRASRELRPRPPGHDQQLVPRRLRRRRPR